MPSTKGLMTDSRTTDIDCGWGMTARMTYDPVGIVTASEEGLETETNQDELARQLCSLVQEWDVTGPVPLKETKGKAKGSLVPDDELIPLDPDIVKWLPQPLLNGIVMGLVIDAQPDPTKMRNRLQKRGTGGTITP